MKIEIKKIKDLKPYENNAKIHLDRQIEAVAESIKQFGIIQPIVVDSNNVMIIGHCRYLSAQKAGIEEFPCIVLDITENEAKALRIIDNKTNESEWNYENLNAEIKRLTGEISLTKLGFSEADLIDIFTDYSAEEDVIDNFEEYVNNADEQLQSTRVILTYKTEEEEEWLSKKLGFAKIGVTCYVRDLM